MTARDHFEAALKEKQEILEANRVEYPDRMIKLLHGFREARKVALGFQREFIEPVASEAF